MKTRHKFFLVALLAAPLVALAQPRSGGSFSQNFNQRQAYQQHRINDGLRSGSLTQHEAARLERGQQQLQRMENHARADGRINSWERARLDRAADRQSQSIYQQKHDRQHDYNHNGRVDGGRYGWNDHRGWNNHSGWGRSVSYGHSSNRGNHYGWYR